MVRRYPPLSERQAEVLGWVSDGCPNGVWDDFTYKRTTYALADRGLVTVDRRRHSWSAALTERGRYYLAHSTYPPDPAQAAAPADPQAPTKTARSKSDRRPAQAREPIGAFSVSPDDLVAALQAKDGVLTVADPTVGVRAAYRSAISRAVTGGLVPDGYVLRHKGRDHGDLVIRLLPHDQAEPIREHLDPIAVPESLHGAHSAVRELRDHHPELLDIGQESRRRALLILQAIAVECDRRGYQFRLRSDGQPTFQITADLATGDVVFAFTLLEEYERREIPDPDELADARYGWQRVRSTVQPVRSGRLVIRLGGRSSAISWADRKRWTLADKLPQLFQHVEQSVTQVAEQRASAEVARDTRRQAWEAARVQAKKAYIADLNRRRLDQQLADHTRATDLRRYATQVDQHAARSVDPNLAQRARDWAAWVHTEADRIDPLQRPEALSHAKPDQIRPTDLDRFMPRGMSAWRPPD